MRLPTDAIIAINKIKNYLLTQRAEDDKSRYLEQAGYSTENWKQLEIDLRQQILVKDALPRKLSMVKCMKYEAR